MKSLCVFCGSSSGAKPSYAESAKSLGNALAKRGISLIYGGASVGLMGTLADTVLKGKGQVFGVIPSSLQEKEIAHKSLTKLYVVDSMHQRKQMMFDLSDGFLMLPGGLGSLEEFCEIMTWAQLGLHKKPSGVLNVDGYYDSLIAQWNHSVKEEMMKPEMLDMILIDKAVDKLLDRMESYQPSPSIEKWIGRKQI